MADGGWGVDALIGRQTRPHADLDLAIGRDDLSSAERALAALGFRRDASRDPGLPARLVMIDQQGREVDFHPLVFDRDGNGSCLTPDKRGGAMKHSISTGSVASTDETCTVSAPSSRCVSGEGMNGAPTTSTTSASSRVSSAYPSHLR